MPHALHKQRVNALEFLFSEEDLVDGKLLYNWRSFLEHISPEIEFLCPQGIFLMCTCKVLPQLRNRNVEIQIPTLMKNPRNQVNNQTIGGILIGRQLHLHGSELHSPSDIIINGNFQPD